MINVKTMFRNLDTEKPMVFGAILIFYGGKN
jgi:hypothetical protein